MQKEEAKRAELARRLLCTMTSPDLAPHRLDFLEAKIDIDDHR